MDTYKNSVIQENLMGKFATALNVPMIIGLLLVPILVAKRGGLGTAISGWLLAAAGFIEGGVATQPESVINMLNVEKANEKLCNEKKMVSEKA